jgi:hypothetical protein
MGVDAMAIEDDVRRWTRVTKLALGLRRPEQPLLAVCPDCDDGQGDLVAAGAERFLQFTRNGVLLGDWEEAGRIYCTAQPRVHAWPEDRWTWLAGRILEAV